MGRINYFFSLFFIIILFLLFRNWIFSSHIIGGDWPFFYQESINDFNFLPPAWSSVHGNGLGGTIIVYALDSYLYFTAWLFSYIFNIPWNITNKIFWFGMFLFGTIFSVWYFLAKFCSQIPKIYRLLGIFVYIANSYILLIVSGGQMGLALAYSVTPLVLARLILVANSKNSSSIHVFNLSIIAGLLFAVQVMFDPRIAYITLTAIALYLVFYILYIETKNKMLYALRLTLYALVIPLVITGLLHAFWLLPLLFTGQSSVGQLGDIYTTSGAVKFFSFAKLENAISLLHPNWPENLFGKVYFMRWEFLLLPILAYSSLLFVGRKTKDARLKKADKKNNNLTIEQSNNGTILFFALLGLIGAFLAKGANEPFGQLYIWLFEHVPGFVMFRDPTKWYLLVAISYSILIPFSIYCIYQWLTLKIKDKRSKIYIKYQKYIPNLFLLFTFCFLLFLIHPALLGQMDGAFKHREVPKEYIALKDRLYEDPEFYRTLWVPKQQRFTFSSPTHPSIEAEFFFNATNAATLNKRYNSKTPHALGDISVRYIIIPHDPYGEIFFDDRKYSQKKRDEYEKMLDKVTWLKKVQDGKITIYETKAYKDHLWLQSRGTLFYEMKSPTEYNVVLKNVKAGDTLVFSENYNSNWRATILEKVPQTLFSKAYIIDPNVNLNRFTLPKDGNYSIKVTYSAEKYYILGRYITLAVLLFLICILFLSTKAKK